MLTKIASATTWGIQTYPIDIEVDLSYGMIQFFIVGLPDATIKESRQRILTALKQCGFRIPERKITVNLAPADLKKEGALFDLPIALGILHEAGFITLPPTWLRDTLFLGELSLDGAIKPVKGILPIACDAARLGKKRLVVAPENAQEALLIDNIEIFGVPHLRDIISHVRGEHNLTPTTRALEQSLSPQHGNDISDVRGQWAAKRALQISAAGRHNLLFMGSPGSGKTMLAQRLPQLLPPLSREEQIETSKIYSISGKLMYDGLITQRPFRAPHHTISAAGLIGGGSVPQPGEISLAHNGVLFLDELTEFRSSTIESLRQPLESHEVHIVRAQHAVSFPANFLLVAALNPCPCGFLGDKRRPCTCPPQRVQNYLSRLSGPLIDRIDIQVAVASMGYDEIAQNVAPDLHASLYEGVLRAQALQKARGNGTFWNGHMTVKHIEQYCHLSDSAKIATQKAFERLKLTMRGYHKMLKIARTIADLAQSEVIEATHIQEAMSYRLIDKFLEQSL
jgi:magnesium chelatase family protein